MDTSECGDELCKLVCTLRPTLVEAHLFVCLSISHSPVTHSGGVFCLTAFVSKGEDHRHKGLFSELPCFGVGISEDEPLVLNDFEIDAAVRKFLAVWASHNNQAGTARSNVGFSDWCCPRQRSKPLLEQFGFRPCTKYLCARRIDDACQDKLTIQSRGTLVWGSHSLSPLGSS